VCPSHGGGSPKVRAAAARRLEEKRTQAVVEYQSRKTGGRIQSIGDVYEELLKTTEMVLVWRDRLHDRVEELTTFGYQSGAGFEQLKTEVALMERAMDRSTSILTTLVKLNIDERAERLSNRYGDLIALAITRILEALDLTPDQQARVPEVVPRILRGILS